MSIHETQQELLCFLELTCLPAWFVFCLLTGHELGTILLKNTENIHSILLKHVKSNQLIIKTFRIRLVACLKNENANTKEQQDYTEGCPSHGSLERETCLL